ncbi:probable E3 ubiquitin-protein ligase RNF217 [Salvia splendens]|uniref:probable E3 ubiquitin-protein ligase RNF217 n=1 Tax=Salvia splendens TaxID=180675 RepID=UPI001C2665AA|nr:probable E3 ubiquitin-protein ligase RNF217 [Salvia splendens]
MIYEIWQDTSGEIWQDTSVMSDEIQQTFTCEICIEPSMLSQKFSHGANCVHNICFMCIGSHIQSKIDDNICTIKCPKLDCGKILTPMECRQMIPSSLFVKWSDCLCLSTVSTYTSCYCPYRDCSELIINECDMPTTKCACPACKRLVCYACRAPWHAGFRCSEASQVKDENDVQFGILLEEMKWKRCPKCGHAIERIQGCRSVTCRCRTNFCYVCGSRDCQHIHQDIVFTVIFIILMTVISIFNIVWVGIDRN